MSDHCDIEMRLVSQARYLGVARAAIEVAVSRLGADDECCGRVMLALDEALSNVIRHGYGERKDGPIWLKFNPREDVDRRGFTMIVEDRGRQTEPESIQPRRLEDVRPGGLGVHIIREVMDEVDFARREGGGMRLTMTKWLDDQSSPTEPQEEPSP